MTRNPAIHQGIARASIPSDDIILCRDQSDIGDTPDIGNTSRHARAHQARLMKRWDQWRALPAGSHVAAPEIRHNGNACALGEPVRIPNLQCVRSASLGVVAKGLPMATNRRDGCRVHICRLQ